VDQTEIGGITMTIQTRNYLPDTMRPGLNARFWLDLNGGPVKVTLRPGQYIEYHLSEPDEEGYRFHTERISYEPANGVSEGYLWRVRTVGGRDCDGLIENTTEMGCPYSQLHSFKDLQGMGWPNWKDLSSSVYDEFAQSAGY